jgi:hypothetical protein
LPLSCSSPVHKVANNHFYSRKACLCYDYSLTFIKRDKIY